jgi:hypothetical protein
MSVHRIFPTLLVLGFDRLDVVQLTLVDHREIGRPCFSDGMAGIHNRTPSRKIEINRLDRAEAAFYLQSSGRVAASKIPRCARIILLAL